MRALLLQCCLPVCLPLASSPPPSLTLPHIRLRPQPRLTTRPTPLARRCLQTDKGQLAVDFIGRVEVLDADMAAALRLINERLPAGVAPLRMPASIPSLNVGPTEEEDGEGGGSGGGGAGGGGAALASRRYLQAYRGGNAACFARASRFYQRDIQLLFPRLWREACDNGTFTGQRGASAASSGSSGGGASDQQEGGGISGISSDSGGTSDSDGDSSGTGTASDEAATSAAMSLR